MLEATEEEKVKDRSITSKAAPCTEQSAVNIVENKTQQDIATLQNEQVDSETILSHDSKLMSIPCPTASHPVYDPIWRDHQNHLLKDKTIQRANSPTNKPVILFLHP